MSKNDEYISVAEFAELAGVSVQAIYKRLNQDLNQYSTKFKGKTWLNIKGLELFDSTKFKPNFKLFKPNFKPVESEFNEEVIEILRQMIDNLEKQLEIKDQLITEQQKEIHKLHSLLENAQRAESETRQLLLIEKKQNLQLVEDEKNKENGEVAEKEKATEKKSLFSRIFN